MNPVAVAQLMAGTKTSPGDAAAVNALLETAYNVDSMGLFDGEGLAGERMELLNALARAADDKQKVNEVMRQKIVQRAIEAYGSEAVSRVLPFLGPLGDAILMPDGAPMQPHHLATWQPCAATAIEAISWQDPVQGTIADCYLIAPMIAIAWAAPEFWEKRIRDSLAAARKRKFPFAFYNGRDTLDPPIRVPLSVAVDDDKRPVFARSSQRVENWPALVEKAYVMKLRRRRGNPTREDYLAIGSDKVRYPHSVARMLAGGRHRTRSSFSDDVGGRPSDVIEQNCDERRLVTRVPMMAWSWDTAADANVAVSWREAGLFPNHAYAVLGIMRQPDKDYVVLRNPYGCSVFRPEGYAEGTWRPGPGPNGEAEVLLNNNGVFAISRKWFDRYMGWLGWLEEVDAPPPRRKGAPAPSRRK